MAALLQRQEDLDRVLREVRTIAILGASNRPDRAGSYVGEYLRRVGYTVLPVNPAHVGETLFGHRVVGTLAELQQPVDMIDVFRRPSAIDGHVDEILAMQPLPSVVWLQLGIRNDRAAQRLIAAGIDVVQDRCTLAEHRASGIGPVR